MSIYHRSLFFISILATFAISFNAYSQNGGTIKGLVIDGSTRYPLPFVSVAVQRSSDSTIVTGQVTDSTGRFSISGVPEGNYYLSGQMIGYKSKKSKPVHLDAGHSLVDIGKLALDVSHVLMDEVQVSTEKSLYTTSIDRKIYNVEKDLLSKSGSASELLQNVPSVHVDIDGNVSLRGSSNVLITVNGRTSPLMNRNSATVLEQMPANTIERIEVITNPTAEFKPDAAAGIINIVLKKNAVAGINGSLTANAGNKDRYNSSINASYNPGPWDISASYGIRRNNRNRNSTDDRWQEDTTFAFYHQATASHARPLSHSASVESNYRPGKQDQLGISGSYFYLDFNRTEAADYNLYDPNRVLTSSFVRNSKEDQTYSEKEFTGFYEHTFPKEDHTLRFEYTASRAPEKEANHSDDIYPFAESTRTADQSLLKSSENSDQVSVEYSNPISEKITLKAGYSMELNRADFDFRSDYFDNARQSFVLDTAKTNRFRFNDAIHSVFATWKQSFGKFGMVVGLRGEVVSVKSNLVTLDSTIDQSYSNVYPSLHLSYGLSKPLELQLSYSKRTRRPDSDDMNPFPEYTDPRNIRSGNPQLRPEYVHSLELGCQYRVGQVNLVPALFYRYTYNRFTWVTKTLNDTVLLTTHDNLSSDQAGGFEINISAGVAKLVSLHGTASIYEDQIDASNITGGKKNVTTWSSNLTMDLNITETSRLQLNSNYRSSQLTAQGNMAPSYTLNGGFRQEMFGGKLYLLATISDIFHTQKREYSVNSATLHQTAVNRMDSRMAYLGLTYRFGTPPKKSKDEQIRYDEGQ